MNESQKIEQERIELMAEMNKVKSENSTGVKAPKIKRSYTYRTSPAIKASDVAAL